MKKKVLLGVLTALVVAMTVFFAGCAHTFTCGWCGKEVTESGHKQTILGQEVEICDDCYNGLKGLAQ